MRSRILAAFVAVSAATASFGTGGVAMAAQSGLTGDPWIDQYIEQVPTGGGGRPSNPNGVERYTSALGGNRLSALARAGGDRFAFAVAATVVPAPKSSAGKGDRDRTVNIEEAERLAAAPGAAESLVKALGGGGGGLGAILPIALIGSVLGAIALAASRFGRSGD